MEFKKKIENYWYHYKWPTIIIAFFVIVIAISITQCSTKTDDDCTVLYGGPVSISTNSSIEISGIFSQLLKEDINNDGSKVVSLNAFLLMTDKQYDDYYEKNGVVLGMNEKTLSDNHQAFSQQVFAGESVILLLDPNWYNDLKEAGGLATFKDAIGYTPDIAIDDYSIYLKDTKFAKYFNQLSVFPEDTILCVRNISTATSFLNQSKQEEKYKKQISYLKNILEFDLEATN